MYMEAGTFSVWYTPGGQNPARCTCGCSRKNCWMVPREHVFSQDLKQCGQITHIVQLQRCQHKEHSDWELLYEIAMQMNLSETSGNKVLRGPCNPPCVRTVNPWWKAGCIHQGVLASKSRESAEKVKICTTYLFYKYWQECCKGETQLNDSYRARNNERWGKYILYLTAMETFQGVLRNHEGLKRFLTRNVTWWLLFEVKFTYKQAY